MREKLVFTENKWKVVEPYIIILIWSWKTVSVFVLVNKVCSAFKLFEKPTAGAIHVVYYIVLLKILSK